MDKKNKNINDNSGAKATGQQEKILESQAPLKRVIACAGSGKTFVLTQSIVRILRDRLCRPDQILAITFTRNAAENMRLQIKSALNKKIDFSSLNIYTFNSFGNKIISDHSFLLGLGKDYQLINLSKSWKLIFEIIKKTNFTVIKKGKDPAGFVNNILNYISDLKSNLITSRDLENYQSKSENLLGGYQSRALENEEREISIYQFELAGIYREYENIKKVNNMVDYHDHIFLPYILLKENSQIKEKYSNRYKYIFVDEFQDTDFAQGYLISLLHKPGYNNMLIVGDDDQGIYSFRGACIENIRNFHKWDVFSDYTVEDFYLTTNFRSGANIVKTIDKLIRVNRDRFTKELTPEYAYKKSETLFFAAETRRQEAMEITKNIIALLSSGLKLKDIAILCRTKKFKYITAELDKNNLKYQLISSRGFYYEPDILFLVSWMMIIQSLENELHIIYVLQSPKFKLSDRDIYFLKNLTPEGGSPGGPGSQQARQKLINSIINHKKNPYIGRTAKKRLAEFLNELNFYLKQSSLLKLSEMVSMIFEFSGLADEIKSGFEKTAKTRIRNVETLIKLSSSFEDGNNVKSNLESFIIYLKDVARTEEEDPENMEFSHSNTIKIMSIHASKGLEFEAVFLPMLWKSEYLGKATSRKFKIPALLRKDREIYHQKKSFSSKQKFEEELRRLREEEERRIFYVACSRAKKLLFLSYCEFENEKEKEIKEEGAKKILPFLADIFKREDQNINIKILNTKGVEIVESILTGPEKKQAGDRAKSNTIPKMSGLDKVLLQVLGPVRKMPKNLPGRGSGESEPEIKYGNTYAEKILASKLQGLKLSHYRQSPGFQQYLDELSNFKKNTAGFYLKNIHDIKTSFSLSEILLFMECPLKYKWQYAYNIPGPVSPEASLGEEVHKNIQLLSMLKFGKLVEKNFINPGDRCKIPDFNSRPGFLKNKQGDFLNNYQNSEFYDLNGIEKMMLEQLFYWRLGGFTVIGKVDRLDIMQDKKIRIIDYKTSAYEKGNFPGSYLSQLKSYAAGVSSIFGIAPEQVSTYLFYLKDGKIKKYNFSRQQLKSFGDKLVRNMEAINKRRFTRDYKGKCPGQCPYFKLCQG